MEYLNDRKLLSLRFSNGMLILPTIRYSLMCHINQESSIPQSSSRSKLSRIKSLICGLAKLKIRKKKILLFSSTLFNVETKTKGHFFNSLDGYYYDIFPNDCLLIEDADENLTWRTTNTYKNLSFIGTYIQLFAWTVSKVCNKINPIKNPDFDYLIEKYPNVYTTSELSLWDYFNRIYYCCMRLFFKWTECKLVAVNCGSYGGTYAPLIKAAHDLNIKVVEMQHGAITSEHSAYHADDFIVNNQEYATYLPDALYSFGEYWKQYIDWKYEILPIGNPYLNEYVSSYINKETDTDFLVISQPVISEDIIKFVRNLSVTFPEKRIRIRLHPRDVLEYYQKEVSNIPNVTLSVSTDNLYKDISSSAYIIGGFSTCLFEALAFNKKLIIIDLPVNRKYFPSDIGLWVKSASELKRICDGPESAFNENSIATTDLWASDFETNVKNALKGYINGERK